MFIVQAPVQGEPKSDGSIPAGSEPPGERQAGGQSHGGGHAHRQSGRGPANLPRGRGVCCPHRPGIPDGEAIMYTMRLPGVLYFSGEKTCLP